MVIRYLLLFMLLLIGLPQRVFSQPIRVYAYTDSDLVVNKPIMGTLEIEHPYNVLIDNMSFKLDGAPLTAEQIKEVRYSQNDPLTLTIFRFQLPPTDTGVHDLGVISVKIGDKTYQSAPSKYEVRKVRPMLQQQYRQVPPAKQSAEKQDAGTAQPVNNNPTLVLEAFVEPNNTLYPVKEYV